MGLLRSHQRSCVSGNEASISHTTPLGGYETCAEPRSSPASPRSISREPNPLRDGGTTGGPFFSTHPRRRRRPPSSPSSSQTISMRPCGTESAPYFAAFVASSCSASAKESATLGERRSGGPSMWKRHSPPPSKGSRAPATTSLMSASSQLSSVSMSCARASASRRSPNARRASSGTSGHAAFAARSPVRLRASSSPGG